MSPSLCAQKGRAAFGACWSPWLQVTRVSFFLQEGGRAASPAERFHLGENLARSLVTSGLESEPCLPHSTEAYEGLSFKEPVKLFLFTQALKRAIRKKSPSPPWDENHSSTAGGRRWRFREPRGRQLAERDRKVIGSVFPLLQVIKTGLKYRI